MAIVGLGTDIVEIARLGKNDGAMQRQGTQGIAQLVDTRLFAQVLMTLSRPMLLKSLFLRRVRRARTSKLLLAALLLAA